MPSSRMSLLWPVFRSVSVQTVFGCRYSILCSASLDIPSFRFRVSHSILPLFYEIFKRHDLPCFGLRLKNPIPAKQRSQFRPLENGILIILSCSQIVFLSFASFCVRPRRCVLCVCVCVECSFYSQLFVLCTQWKMLWTTTTIPPQKRDLQQNIRKLYVFITFNFFVITIHCVHSSARSWYWFVTSKL